jgi:DNA segregation ATPase FtsK/SpoIIIE-like protein
MRYMLQPPPIVGLDGDTDELFKKAVEEVVQYDRASASLLQRRMSIGYARAARLIDQLQTAGVLGPAEGSQPRAVLIKSAEELFGDNWEKLQTKEVEESVLWTPEAANNYIVPSKVKLSDVNGVPWGTQFSDAYKRTDFKDSEVEFPLHLGFDEEGNLKTVSLIDASNLIIAGNPLSQKENIVDTFLITLLLRYHPSELKLILIDPSHYLDFYNGIPHLLSPVIHDFDKAVSAYRWLHAEMNRRQKQFSEAGVRDITHFNEMSGFMALPRVLTITFIDFLSVETEDALVRLTAQGPRTGIHNILIADHTNGSALPGVIKNNIPARVVFRMSSAGESKAIEVSGAEKLQPGEIIYKPNYGNVKKLNAIFTPEVHVKEVIKAVTQVQ